MHRSGTSMISQWLYNSGFHLGEQLLGPGVGNVEGHFEDVDFIDFHKEVLKANQLPETGLTDKPILQLSLAQKQKLKGIIEDKNKISDEWGWKDPRTCLFLPVYRELIPHAFYLIIVRDFASTVISLISRIFVKRNTKKRGFIDRFIWKTVRGQLRRRKLFKNLTEPYIKVWIANNKAIRNHISKLPKNSFLVIDYDMLKTNDQLIFSHLKENWNFHLDYVDFKQIYKDKFISETENIELYVKNKELLSKAKILENDLRSFM